MSTLIDRLPIDTVDAATWTATPIGADLGELDEALVHEAAMRARSLPIDVDDALARFVFQLN